MKWLRQFWVWNRTLGLGSTIVVNILIFVSSYFIVVVIHQIGFYQGWWKSQGRFNLEDFVWAAITGCICGIIEFSNRKKKIQVTEER